MVVDDQQAPGHARIVSPPVRSGIGVIPIPRNTVSSAAAAASAAWYTTSATRWGPIVRASDHN